MTTRVNVRGCTPAASHAPFIGLTWHRATEVLEARPRQQQQCLFSKANAALDGMKAWVMANGIEVRPVLDVDQVGLAPRAG